MYSRKLCFISILFFVIQGYTISLVDAYDPLDPHGNITIKWDIIKWGDYDETTYDEEGKKVISVIFS
ncbi:Cobra-like protein [Thalictrum thalictroides]|uniref:Cobra-like protein n=1 Tax=Thalictrum thalictroides TaxID=46969 RepID=A0A7J6VJF6_THATH|nr:Cobra-like protein [Thalictrum thalictroides]